MGHVCIEIPREVFVSTRLTTQEIRRELALAFYQQNRISFGKAREMAGLNVWAFQHLLGERDIPVNYDQDDFFQDISTLKHLGRI